MAIDSTLILEDIEKIARSGTTPYHNYELELFLEAGYYKVTKVIDIVHNYDYMGGYGCEIMVTVAIGFNDYTRVIMASKGQIKAKLYDICGTNTTITEYHALIDVSGNPDITTSISSTDDDFNSVGMRYCTLQLIDSNLLQLKDELCGGVYRNCTMKEVLTTLFGYSLNRIKTMNNQKALYLNLAEPDNTRVYSQIDIPPMNLFELPRYLQERYGVYSYDISYYYQDNTMSIYPLYKLDNFENVERKVIFYTAPINRIGGIERTWRNDGLTIYAINYQGMINVNRVENSELEYGNSVLKPTGNTLLTPGKNIDGTVEMELDRNANTVEYAMSKRNDNVLNVAVSDEFTTNDYKFYSMMAAKYGVLYDIPWDSCVNGIIAPNTPIKVIREQNNAYIEEYGIIFSFKNYEKIRSGTFYDTEYVANGVLRVMVIPSEIQAANTTVAKGSEL